MATRSQSGEKRIALATSPAGRGASLPASLSLDLDNKWSYLKTHGDPGWETFPSYLDIVVPHALRILQQLQLKITVFVVGQDAALPKNADALASIAGAGHEIGNHSFHHEPWLQQYTAAQIERELSDAEHAIEAATGQRPCGFRGPGFSFSPTVLSSLVRRGYDYDASTFPTFLGPVARAYYFLSTRLDQQKRQQRKDLFGGFTEGFRPLKPYHWRFDDPAVPTLLEIPVTTIPVIRSPFHLSYLLFLLTFSRTLAWAYWKVALANCRLAGVRPSLLLHPLDFVGGDEVSDLDFFPAMSMQGSRKRAFVQQILADYASHYRVGTLAEQAAIERQRAPAREFKLQSPPAPPPATTSQPLEEVEEVVH